jgi:hypothetical protein
MEEELRRTHRVSVCCRVVARDRFGAWSAVTEDVCAHGCRIVTARLLRPGCPVHVTLASDLFAEELEAQAEAVWATPDLLGVRFVRVASRARALTAEAWVDRLIDHGAVAGAAPGALLTRIVPALMRPGRAAAPAAAPELVTAAIVHLPIRRG